MYNFIKGYTKWKIGRNFKAVNIIGDVRKSNLPCTAFIKSYKLVGRFLGNVFKYENFPEEISFYDA
jgi:hypothetical protein